MTSLGGYGNSGAIGLRGGGSCRLFLARVGQSRLDYLEKVCGIEGLV